MKLRRKDIDQLENSVLNAALILAVVFSIATNFWPISVAWQMPLVFLALYSIIKLLLKHVNQTEAIITVDFYPTNSAFYAEISHFVQQSEQRISALYLRRVPPSAFISPQAKGYFKSVLEWAKAAPSRSVRRIICIPDEGMLEWARQHHAETRAIHNYEVRVVDWPINADAMNLAIFDDQVAFMAFSGETEQDVRGLGMRDDRAVAYFNQYYNQWWNAAVPLEGYLAKRDQRV